MRTQFKKFRAILTFMVMGLFIACPGGSPTPPSPPPPVPSTYSISGTVSGSVAAGVSVSIAPTPTGGTPWVTTDSKGFYTFASIPNGTFVLTPFISGRTFTPASATVAVNGANVTGVNFNSPLPMLNTGKLLYATITTNFVDFSRIYSLDLATGAKTTIYDRPIASGLPNLIVSLRGANKKIAYRIDGTRYLDSGIWNYDLTTATTAYGIPVQGIIVDTYWTTTFGSFDVGLDPIIGSFGAITLQNSAGVKNVFLVLMDGTLHWSPVTTDILGAGAGNYTSPVIINPGAASGDVTVLYIKNGNECWKQVVNYPAVNAPTLYLPGVMDSTRPMSVNADYTLLAYMKNVSGVAHVVIKTLASGAEVDLGLGSDPSWSFNGNGMLLYTSGNALWAVNPDGTGKIQVPTPSDLRPGALSSVVFGPSGF